MNSVEFEWRIRRLSKMSASEMSWRVSDHVRRRLWVRQQVAPGVSPETWKLPSAAGASGPWNPSEIRQFRWTLPPEALRAVSADARQGVFSAAEEILAGRWEFLGTLRQDLEDPDWFFDPVTGRRAPQFDYCFKVNHRSEVDTGNVKQIWELSRMHHVTVLAAAFALSDDERYAERAATHLRSWWAQNPFLSGVHWTSGIETGLRLINWVWVRRLLQNWGGVTELFELNEVALAQIWWHQYYLASFRSRGSSANNHVIAEAAGLLVAASAFDWFTESPQWAERAARMLERELANNTFPSGVNREMAFEYHGFVADLATVAGVEADRSGHPLSEDFWNLLYRMFNVVAATVDVRLQAPRYGDGDNGMALLLSPEAETARWSSLLSTGQALFEPPTWWPMVTPTVTSTLLSAMVGHRRAVPHSPRRPNHFADAGITLMRSSPSDGEEIWCRCDSGPHGFLSIAAHAHADALAIEVRHDGTEVLADPGTYCYHGEARWRDYFRSTLAHNTIEVGHENQSTSGGPFLWTRHAHSKLIELETDPEGAATGWVAEHNGYCSLNSPVRHVRSVRLASQERHIAIVDRLETKAEHPFRLAFHFGPDICARMVEEGVGLTWLSESSPRSATLVLPSSLSWSLFRGESDPVLGWYSPRFGVKTPSWTVVGEAICTREGENTYASLLQFDSDPRACPS
jgi:hypothetical protein